MATKSDDSTPTHEDEAAQPASNVTPKTKMDPRTLKPTPEQHEINKESYETQSFYPPSWTRYEKMTKENADYRQGTPFHHCGACSYYESRHCKIVAGYIAPEMGCRYYSQRYNPDRFGITMVKIK